MVRRFVAVLFALASLGASVAAAQYEAKREFGVDLGFVYASPDVSDSYFLITTPVDLRVGFVMSPKMTLEPRLNGTYISSSGNNAYTFGVDLNLLYGMNGNRNGLYLTVGGGLNMIGGTGISSANQFGVNGGIGTRSGLMRAEAFAGYNFEGDFESSMEFGVRLGLSFWN